MPIKNYQIVNSVHLYERVVSLCMMLTILAFVALSVSESVLLAFGVVDGFAANAAVLLRALLLVLLCVAEVPMDSSLPLPSQVTDRFLLAGLRP